MIEQSTFIIINHFGVSKEVGENNELWYKREFTIPSNWKNKNVLLNFGAVDWKTDVFVNDILIGSHEGGFTCSFA